jgi:hypothetical protein
VFSVSSVCLHRCVTNNPFSSPLVTAVAAVGTAELWFANFMVLRDLFHGYISIMAKLKLQPRCMRRYKLSLFIYILLLHLFLLLFFCLFIFFFFFFFFFYLFFFVLFYSSCSASFSSIFPLLLLFSSSSTSFLVLFVYLFFFYFSSSFSSSDTTTLHVFWSCASDHLRLLHL